MHAEVQEYVGRWATTDPSLVQHEPFLSLIDPNRPLVRLSPTFEE